MNVNERAEKAFERFYQSLSQNVAVLGHGAQLEQSKLLLENVYKQGFLDAYYEIYHELGGLQSH